jgi:hypothetical protein
MNKHTEDDGIIWAVNQIMKHFDPGKPKRAWVPTIADPAEILTTKCHDCNGKGERYRSYVPEGGMAPVAGLFTCDTCHGRKTTEHRFPADIVTLAKKLLGQDTLTIAKTLAGWSGLKMKP